MENDTSLTPSLNVDSISESESSQIFGQDSSITIDTSKVDTSKIRDAVDGAFESDNRVKVGPAAVKAKTDKYSENAEIKGIPTVGHINDEIFSSSEKVADDTIAKDVQPERGRETPIIVPERQEVESTKTVSIDSDENRFVFSMSNSDSNKESEEDNYLKPIKAI